MYVYMHHLCTPRNMHAYPHQNVFIFVCVSSVVWLHHDIYK